MATYSYHVIRTVTYAKLRVVEATCSEDAQEFADNDAQGDFFFTNDEMIAVSDEADQVECNECDDPEHGEGPHKC